MSTGSTATHHQICSGTVARALLLAVCVMAAVVRAQPPALPVSMPAASPPATTHGMLHVVAGQSMFLSSPHRLALVYISNPAVIDSYTVSPWQILLTAKAPGMSSVVLRDEQGSTQVYPVSSDTGVEDLRNALRLALPGEELSAQAAQDRITISGTVSSQAAMETAVKLAGLYSTNVANSLVLLPTHAAQVELKVRIIEVDRSKLDQAGLNFFSGGKNIGASSTGQFPISTSITNGGGSASGSSGSTFEISDPLNLLFYNTTLNVGLAIRDLENRQILQILAEPTITTISGKKAEFLSGGEFPFPVVQGGTGGFTSVTIQFRPFGVKLAFTPIVNADGTIQLEVAPEVSALDYTNAVTISGYTIPALSTRRAETQVELKDGQSFAISGLLDHRTTLALSKMPGIGDVPVLGALFRSKGITRSVAELMVIVTPTVVNPLNPQPERKPPTGPAMPVPNLDTQTFDSRAPSAKKQNSPTNSGSSH